MGHSLGRSTIVIGALCGAVIGILGFSATASAQGIIGGAEGPTPAVQTTTDQIEGAVGGPVEDVEAAADDLGQAAEPATPPTPVTPPTEQLGQATEQVAAAANGAAESVEQAVNQTAAPVENTTDAISAAAQDASESVGKAVGSLGPAAGEATKNVSDLAEQVTKPVGKAVDSLGPAAGEATKNVRDLVTAATDLTKQTGDRVGDVIGQAQSQLDKATGIIPGGGGGQGGPLVDDPVGPSGSLVGPGTEVTGPENATGHSSNLGSPSTGDRAFASGVADAGAASASLTATDLGISSISAQSSLFAPTHPAPDRSAASSTSGPLGAPSRETGGGTAGAAGFALALMAALLAAATLRRPDQLRKLVVVPATLRPAPYAELLDHPG